MRPDRIPCAVPFCRRTAAKKDFPDSARIICGKHWRLGDERWRRLYSKARRRFLKTESERDGLLINYCWDRVLRQAIERAAGITG